MDKELEQKKELACWIARELFTRKMGPGTTGNLSFLHDGKMYITAGGTCFGRLSPDDLSEVDPRTGEYSGKKPSKETALHLTVYRHRPDLTAVIHVHSTYAVLLSCIPRADETDCIPAYTPYLRMKLGSVGLIPYAKPGSEELFSLFAEHIDKSDGWILKNHGPVVGGKDLMDAFACTEELEEACRTAWELKDLGIPEIGKD